MFVIERETSPGTWTRGVDYFWNQRPAIAVAKRTSERWKLNHRVVSFPDPTQFCEVIPYTPPAALDAAALVKEVWG